MVASIRHDTFRCFFCLEFVFISSTFGDFYCEDVACIQASAFMNVRHASNTNYCVRSFLEPLLPGFEEYVIYTR